MIRRGPSNNGIHLTALHAAADAGWLGGIGRIMRSQSYENPEHALVRSIALPNLQEVIGDVGEAYLDQILDEGVLRDIPIIASILRLRATVGAVRDYVFTKKVARS